MNYRGAPAIAFAAIAMAAGVLLVPGISGQQTSPQQPAFNVLQFDEINHMCRANGRLQDKEYCSSKMMNQILAMGSDAIPILITQLTGTRKTSEPIYDFWSYTAAGDVAYFILRDLFTDSDLVTSTMPGVELPGTDCVTGAETCWREFVKMHGRRYIQRQWLSAWNKCKDRISWDSKSRCFRVASEIPAPR